MRHPLRLFLVVVAFAAMPLRAHADATAEAKQHFDLATVAHKEGRYADALSELMASYALEPRAELLFAIGQIHVKLGQCPQAVTFYQRFLATRPKPEVARRVKEAIEVCNMAPPPVQIPTPDPAKPPAVVGPSPEEQLRKAKEAEAIAAIEQRRLEEARIAAERDREREKLYDRHPARKLSYVGAGVGAASLIIGGVFGLSSRDAQASFTDAGCGDRSQRLSAEAIASCDDDAARGERSAQLGNVFMIAGGAILATSVLVFVLDPGNKERTETAPARVTLTPTSIHFMARW